MRDPFLLAVLVVAAVLRLYGLDHGLPFVYNPDEANIMARSLAVARGLDPGYYLYPSFFFYFLFGVMGALYVVAVRSAATAVSARFRSGFLPTLQTFTSPGRLVGVAAALATIVLTYHLAAKHFGRTAGRASAALRRGGLLQRSGRALPEARCAEWVSSDSRSMGDRTARPSEKRSRLMASPA